MVEDSDELSRSEQNAESTRESYQSQVRFNKHC